MIRLLVAAIALAGSLAIFGGPVPPASAGCPTSSSDETQVSGSDGNFDATSQEAESSDCPQDEPA